MRRNVQSLMTLGLTLGALVALHLSLSDDSADVKPVDLVTPDAIETTPRLALTTKPLTHYDPVQQAGPTLTIPPSVKAALEAGEFGDARAQLMTRADAAVERGAQHEVAASLTLLGMAALAEPDFDAAELFFMEALDIYSTHDNVQGQAMVYLQIGQLHVMKRERARSAALAYDALLVARWKMSDGQHFQAQADLQQIINKNVELQRFGAAASASESLVKAWRGMGDQWQAEQAAMSAVRLYAAAGQTFKVEQLLVELQAGGSDPTELQAIREQAGVLLNEFNQNVTQVDRARDYQRLYNHYRAKGDMRRAWKFRVLASQSLAGAPRRAMYYRQPDVLVTLYGSNQNMDAATRALRKAYDYFQANEQPDSLQAVKQLRSQIY